MIERHDWPALVAQADASLQQLATSLNAAHDQCEQAMQTGLQHALEAGRLLTQAKGRVPHGHWLDWLREHCHFSVRSAQGYMRLARRFAALDGPKAQRVALLPYREALRELTAEDDAPEGTTAPAGADEAAERAPEQPPIVGERTNTVSLSLLEALAPAVLRVYIREGVLSADHLPPLLALREDYGEDLMQPLIEPDTREPVCADLQAAEAIINHLRPEDIPGLWYLRLPYSERRLCPEVVVEATLAFDREAVRRGTLLQWEVAAFWWASQAVMIPLGAQSLAHHIGLWRERFHSALVWWVCLSPAKDPLEWSEDDGAGQDLDDLRSLWWGFHSDLRHSGALQAATALREDEGGPHGLRQTYHRALEEAHRAGSYILPTAVVWRSVRKEREGQEKATTTA